MPSTLIPKGENVIAAFGVNFDTSVKPGKPMTLTLSNPNITSHSQVYKILNGKLVPVTATVTDGKAVIQFTTDPDFVIVQPTTSSATQPPGSAVSGATTPVTGFPAAPWAAGGILGLFTGALLLWRQRKRGATKE